MSKKDTRHLYKTGFQNSSQVIKVSDEQIDELKQILITILKDFVSFAEEYHLKYSLGGGSVLGAVRHAGIIPWDDDIDINMPREDYNRFLELFDDHYKFDYYLCSPEKTKNHGMLCAQIKKKNTLYKSFNELSKTDEECGICIDIFVAENVYNNPLARKIQGVIALCAGYLSTCRKTYNDMSYLEPYLEANSTAKKGFQKKARIGRIFSWWSLDGVTRFANKCYAMCKDNNSQYVSFPSGRKHFFGEMLERKELCEYVKKDFEGLYVNVPAGFQTYLSGLYGDDYMKLPPEAKRETHPFMALSFDTTKEDK